MKISIKMGASRTNASDTISVDDLGLSQSEWENMTEHERSTAIQEYLDDSNDQPYWVLEDYREY